MVQCFAQANNSIQYSQGLTSITIEPLYLSKSELIKKHPLLPEGVEFLNSKWLLDTQLSLSHHLRSVKGAGNHLNRFLIADPGYNKDRLAVVDVKSSDLARIFGEGDNSLCG